MLMTEEQTKPGDGPNMRMAASRLIREYVAFAGRRGLSALFLVAASALFESVSIVLLVPIIQSVVSPASLFAPIARALDAIGAETPMARLLVLTMVFIGLVVLRSLLHYARDMVLGTLQADFVEHQRIGVMRRIAAAPWDRLARLRHSRVSSLMMMEVSRLGIATQFLLQGSVSLVMLFAQASIAFLLAPGFASACGALLLIGGYFALRLQRRSHQLGRKLGGASQGLMGASAGFLGAMKAVAAENAQAAFIAEFSHVQKEMRGSTLAFQRQQANTRRSFAIFSAVAGSAVVLAGQASGLAPAVLITLVFAFARMSGPAMQVQQSMQQFVFSLPSHEAILALANELDPGQRANDDPARASASRGSVAPLRGDISLRGAVYRHEGGGGIGPIDLDIPAGSFIGISGPSGAGKTTLMDVLIGLTTLQKGTMSVDSIVMDDSARSDWRQHIAYVPQQGLLFPENIRRNLVWGLGEIGDDTLWAALDQVGLSPIIRRLPGGLDAPVGERGTTLSGGEQQRLALARALLRRPKLLALDEALNAIDATAEATIIAMLAAMPERPTIIMISHRAESLAPCDRVLTVADGLISG